MQYSPILTDEELERIRKFFDDSLKMLRDPMSYPLDVLLMTAIDLSESFRSNIYEGLLLDKFEIERPMYWDPSERAEDDNFPGNSWSISPDEPAPF